MIYFTSDTHFGHGTLCAKGHRPFSSYEEMDNVLMSAWNARVTQADDVYHLGDFAWRNPRDYFLKLRGTKHLIIGNHDHTATRKQPWASVQPALELEIGADLVCLSHYAYRVWNKSHYGSIHLYGHSHSNLPGDNQCCDVGVDNRWTNWGPVTLEEIKAQLATQPARVPVDHHVGRE